MSKSILSSIIESALAPDREVLFVASADELVLQKELDSAINLLANLKQLKVVSENCLVMEGAVKDANVMLFETLAVTAYTEEAAKGILEKTKDMIVMLVRKIADTFQKYIGSVIRGNEARIKQMNVWIEHLKTLDQKRSTNVNIRPNRALLFGEDFFEFVNDTPNAFAPLVNYIKISETALDSFSEAVNGAGIKVDYAKFNDFMASLAEAKNNKWMLFQKTDMIGFALLHSAVSDTSAVFPSPLPPSNKAIQGDLETDPDVLGKSLRAWIKVIADLEANYYSDNRINGRYKELSKIAEKSEAPLVIESISQFISAHGRFTKQRVSMTQDAVNSIMTVMHTQFKAIVESQAKGRK